MKILLVEDDKRLSGFVSRVLSEEGFAVDTCFSGAQAARQAIAVAYDVIVLDWMLPDLDGLSVCRELRQKGCDVPVLMLTARGEVQEKVLGLEAGADDYLVKPFDVDEFVARINALLRRASGHAKLRCGPLEIDRVARQVRCEGAVIELTAREYSLLLHLVYHQGKVVTRSELLARVWESHFDPSSNFVEVHVSRLRDKLGPAAERLETVRGMGYRLRAGEPE
ncbi:MAG: response regulator transcription factor [Deltaproteobacteria bacterium]|nr:response regulator transcription factor [Deltaproteobacteria bacterium]